MSDEIDAIRARKMEQMTEALQANVEEQANLEQQISQLEAFVKSRFSKEAILRYGNIKIIDPDKAVQLLVILSQLLQSGRINHIDDDMLKSLLVKITPQKKEFKIKRV